MFFVFFPSFRVAQLLFQQLIRYFSEPLSLWPAPRIARLTGDPAFTCNPSASRRFLVVLNVIGHYSLGLCIQPHFGGILCSDFVNRMNIYAPSSSSKRAIFTLHQPHKSELAVLGMNLSLQLMQFLASDSGITGSSGVPPKRFKALR